MFSLFLCFSICTFPRILTPFIFSRMPEVYFLECDTGQTEFTPPAILSLNKVTFPVLGKHNKTITSIHWKKKQVMSGQSQDHTLVDQSLVECIVGMHTWWRYWCVDGCELYESLLLFRFPFHSPIEACQVSFECWIQDFWGLLSYMYSRIW